MRLDEKEPKEKFIWKEIEGDWRGKYRINQFGHVEHWVEYRHKWLPLKPHINGLYRPVIHMIRSDGSKTVQPLTRLVANAFLGGIPPGYDVVHRNGVKLDCAATNLMFMRRKDSCRLASYGKRRTVFKIDRNGNILDIYNSATVAAKKNFISRGALSAQCRGEVKNPYKYNDFTFLYEDVYEKKYQSKYDETAL